MDTSETYIKMRLAAIPDLGMGKPAEAFASWATDFVFIDSKGDWYYSDETRACQLESQDQLQEIVLEKGQIPISLIGKVAHYNSIPMWMNTWEQYWLAFVMKEKYNKTWNGEEWVKAE